MFDNCDINYERGKDVNYYEQIVRKTNFSTFEDLEDKIFSSLYSQYKKFPTPESYMKRIVDKMCDITDGWQNDTLRLRILKQFIRYGNYLKDAGFGGKNYIEKTVQEKIHKAPSMEEVLNQIQDDIFDILNSANKQQKKPKGQFGLLKLADDLACGNFRTGGQTKRGLYLFAMVFNMKYSSNSEDTLELDVEKNLFYDYYSNNVMRYISDSYRKDLSSFDQQLSGQGINYKNYVEMVYLYYIASDYSPAEKIKYANEMIEELNECLHEDEINTKRESYETQYYKNLDFDEIFTKNASEFKKFLFENYNLHNDSKVSPIELEKQQNTAYKNYKEILNKMSEMEGSYNYGLWFTDVDFYKKMDFKELQKRYPTLNKDQLIEFYGLLKGVQNYLGIKVQEQESESSEEQEHVEVSKIKPDELCIEDASKIKRTSLIVAYYYYYNALHEEEMAHKMKNFQELFNDFKKGVDKYLQDSYYQPISGKNIFDIVVIFSSYAYLNF